MDAADQTSAEIPLTGGNSGPVARVGATVRRPAGDWTPTVHRLLQHLRAAGIRGIPQPVGIDDRGREVLTFVEGEVANYPMPATVWSERVLVDAARLLRDIHDASVSFDRSEAEWRQPARAPAEVVVHNDFAPYNLVFDGGSLVGVIDWDWAAPGPRVWDLSYLVYRLVPLCSEPAPPLDIHRRIDLVIEAYGWPISRSELLATMVDRLEALATFTVEQARSVGDPELIEHARLYRADAAAIRELR